MYDQMTADVVKQIRELTEELAAAKREAGEWRGNFAVLQHALVGDTGASGITVAAALRKDAERWRWARCNAIVLDDFTFHVDDEVEEFVDAQISAAPAFGAA